MTIFIVRHGETLDNVSRTFQTPESPLSDNGNTQAEQLSLRLGQADLSDIVCSDYLRTKETASYVVSKTGITPIFSELLRERNFGELRGRPYAELSFDPFALSYQPINGENWDAFNQRVARAWQFIVDVTKHAEGNVLVVTHGFVCRSIVANHTSLGDDIVIPTRWGNTSLTEIESAPSWRVTRINCVDHLSSDLQSSRSLGQI